MEIITAVVYNQCELSLLSKCQANVYENVQLPWTCWSVQIMLSDGGGSYSNHKNGSPNSMGYDLMSCPINNWFSFVCVLYEFMKVMHIELCNQEQFSECIIIFFSGRCRHCHFEAISYLLEFFWLEIYFTQMSFYLYQASSRDWCLLKKPGPIV